MATYEELFDLRRNHSLLDKITTAVIVATDDIRTEPVGVANHANRVIWSREAAKSPRQMAEVFMAMVLAANKTATVGNISGASDTAIQTNVDAVIDYFADGNAVL